MPILSRYFLRIFLPLFMLCLAVFTAVLMMNQFLRLFNLALMKGISPLWILGCFARLLPFMCSLAVPMAFVVALLLAFGQLADGGEVLALRSCGFSFVEMTWPFLALSIALSGVLLYLNHKASPDGFHAFRNEFLAAGRQITRVDVESQSFMDLGPWKLYADYADAKSGLLDDVYLVRSKGGAGTQIEAKRGRLTVRKGVGATLELEDGELRLPNTDPSKFTSGHFDSYRVDVPASGGVPPERTLDIQELSSPRLLEAIRNPKTTPQHKVEYTVELAVRSAGALSPFVFFWLAAPLGLQLGRQSRSRGFVLSLGILFAFYGLLATGIAVGRRRPALASVAPWGADMVGLALGIALVRRVSRQ